MQLCSLSVARPIGAVEEGMHDVAALLELGRAVADELRGRDRHDARSGRRLRATLAGLEDLRYGVDVARRAWLTRDDVFNTAPLAEIAERLEARKARKR